MSVLKNIETDLKEAMKSRDSFRLRCFAHAQDGVEKQRN